MVRSDFALELLGFFALFGVLLKLVANQGVEEGYDKVEDHSCYAPLPDRLDKWLFFSVKFLLGLEQSFLLVLDLLPDGGCHGGGDRAE